MTETVGNGQQGPPGSSTLVDSLDHVRGRLTHTTFPLEGAGVPELRARRGALLDQLDDYLLPRLRSAGAPLLVVVGGSTGAGKSTLVNSILGEALTRPGVLRPTTRSPVLVHHPSDAPWFGPERILPTLPRVQTQRGTATPLPIDDLGPDGLRSLRLAPFVGMPPGLALLDAPDIDSFERANRDLSAQLLAAADLWLFVTTAARYADAVPWDLLNSAVARHAQIALVLDRVDPGSDEVAVDLARLMRANGLADAPLFVVPEADLDAEGLLPERAVAEVSGWLSDLGGSAKAREQVATATRDGVLDDLVRNLGDLAAGADEQEAARARLAEVVQTAYAEASLQVRAATSDGAMLRGEVLGRWQDFVGASDVMRTIERGVGRFRDSIGAFFRGGRTTPAEVEVAIAQGLAAVTLDAIEGARERTRALWRADPAGRDLVIDAQASAGVTGANTADLRSAIATQMRGWQEDVLAVVREQGEDRRGLARALSFGVNGLGVAVMVLVFAGTGGLTGAEIGVAGGTAVLAQKVLEAAFGDDAVRRLTQVAQERLDLRLGSLLEADASIATTRLAALGIDAGDGDALRRSAQEVATATSVDRNTRSAATPAGPADALPVGPRLRGAHLRGTLASDEELSPYRTSQAQHERAVVPIQEEPGIEPERPGFWRRLFGGQR